MAKHAEKYKPIKRGKKKKRFQWEGSYLQFLLNKDKREIYVERGKPDSRLFFD